MPADAYVMDADMKQVADAIRGKTGKTDPLVFPNEFVDEIKYMTYTPPHRFTMNFDPVTFKTDPTGCITYADDSAGYIKLSNTASTLQKVTDEGSWGFNDNPLFKKFCYATFDASGAQHEILDPYDLTKTKDGQPSSITTENTMLCVPTIYISVQNGNPSLDLKANGDALAHTIDRHVYKWVAYPVYNGTVRDGKLMSVSGALPTKRQDLLTFRQQAQANPVVNGHAMLPNYYHWMLYKLLVIMAMGSFNSQDRIGQGGNPAKNNRTGRTNSMGPFAGNVIGKTNAVKALIEDPWGSQDIMIDDTTSNVVNGFQEMWVGQNSKPITSTENKEKLCEQNTQGGILLFDSIKVGPKTWGMPSESYGGSSTTGACDSYDTATLNNFIQYRVGGADNTVNLGWAGINKTTIKFGETYSSGDVGARPVFVFD